MRPKTTWHLFSEGAIRYVLELAIRAAREAGELLRSNFGRTIDIGRKGRIDIVTDVDLASERLIKNLIATHYPRHSILGEETGDAGAPVDAEYRWIVDPLDGTTNYAHGYPCFCVSIGLYRSGNPVLGVVYDPMRDELFVAERGNGALLNARSIRVSETALLVDSLVCTGFPYDFTNAYFTNLDRFREFSLRAQGVRRDGSAALDLCYVACGRFDGFWERGLKVWDSAAAAVVIAEAGGRLTDYSGLRFDPLGVECVASNGHIHDEMLAVIRSQGSDAGSQPSDSDRGARLPTSDN